MTRIRTLVILGLACCTLLAACAAPSPTGPSPSGGAQTGTQPRTTPKRITAAVRGDAHTVVARLAAAGQPRVLGVGDLQNLVGAGLTTTGLRVEPLPQLAEAVPSTENGLWTVFPDGRMETTWKLRPGIQWHDGTPITAADLAFSLEVSRDREIPIFNDIAFSSIDRLETPDPRTVVVYWSRPYIDADSLFTAGTLLPLPKHLLQMPYETDKANFLQLPYWSTEYVGAGPFVVKDWQTDAMIVLDAFDGYVLGRPKVDQIVVRFIPDDNAMLASVLAGETEVTLGRAFSPEQAEEIRSRWTNGRVDSRISGGLVIYPQMIDPDPPIVTDLTFRRALMAATDRQQLADSLTNGLAPMSHAFLSPEFPGYDRLEPGIMKYAYDPRLGAQLMEGLGYTKGPDGMYRSPSGQPLAVVNRVSNDSLNRQGAFAIADYWKQFGVAVETVVTPPQRAADREYGATFPGFFVNRQRSDLGNLANFHSSKTPLRSNNFTGSNYARYQNPAFDALLDRFFVTIPMEERLAVLRDILHHFTEQLTMMTMFYTGDAAPVAHKLKNVAGRTTDITWNAHLWDTD